MADDRRRSRFGAAGRLAFFPARVAARASRAPLEAAADEHLVPELERLLDRALEGSLPEDLARSIAEHRVIERMATELAANGALDLALESALASPRAAELTERLVQSDEMRRAIREVVASPAVREAIAQQSAGLAEELFDGIRADAARLDDRVERAARRSPRQGRTPFAGIATRAAAFLIDVAVIVGIVVSLAALVALVSSIFGPLRPKWLVATLGSIAGYLISIGYLVLFWHGAGRTPGMHLVHLRVRRRGGSRLSFGRAIVRAVGTWLAVVPLFAGYLPVLFDRDRRGLPDFLAGSEVVYDDPATSGSG
jgi:uncharacterized RDD family membrane protein YckC